MIFKETLLKGALIIELEKKFDERGFFARSFCENEFLDKGLISNFKQCNISFNEKKGILRGMHYQLEPASETKLVRCTKGAIYDVIIDLRKDSSTYTNWYALELTEENYLSLYIPDGFAHGFQTLTDNTEVFYQMSEFYNPLLSEGIRWDDSSININWPISDKIVSQKDCSYKDFIV